MESLHKAVDSVTSYLAIGLVGLFVGLVRKVLTNEKRIEADTAEHKAQMDLIRSEIKSQDEFRQRERERDREDIQELKRDVKSLISRG